jgi:hypothetical protein
MGLKAFFSRNILTRAIDSRLDTQAPILYRGRTRRIVPGVRKCLYQQHYVEPDTMSASVPTSFGPQATPLYCYKPPTSTDRTIHPPTLPTSRLSVNESDKVEQDTEYQAAMEGLNRANSLLQQRHAVVKTQCKSRAPEQHNTPERPFKNEALSPVNNARIASLPSFLPTPSYREVKKPETVNEACDALKRRQLIRALAYHAIGGCGDALVTFDKLNARFILKARHQGDEEIPDLMLRIDGIPVATNQLGTVEKTWISRIVAANKLQSLADRKHLRPKDHEQIVMQVFPIESSGLLKPEYFKIFVTGLGTEGIITASEAKYVIELSASPEEFEAGARWIGVVQSRAQIQLRDSRPTTVNFDIPKQEHRSAIAFAAHPLTSPQPDLYYYLRVLVEAAAYEQKLWKGYFFANAQSMLNSFYEAFVLRQQGLLTPPHLTHYKRSWTYRETRLLQRGHLIYTLLQSFDEGTLTDFGIIRVVRGTFVRLPGQGYWDVEQLSTYLYHHILDSGLALSKVPEILALHPEHDKEFANVRLGAHIRKELEENAELFRQEEHHRLREIVTSVATFEALNKTKMTKWERLRAKWNKCFEKNEIRVPFDPLAQTEEAQGLNCHG